MIMYSGLMTLAAFRAFPTWVMLAFHGMHAPTEQPLLSLLPVLFAEMPIVLLHDLDGYTIACVFSYASMLSH